MRSLPVVSNWNWWYPPMPRKNIVMFGTSHSHVTKVLFKFAEDFFLKFFMYQRKSFALYNQNLKTVCSISKRTGANIVIDPGLSAVIQWLRQRNIFGWYHIENRIIQNQNYFTLKIVPWLLWNYTGYFVVDMKRRRIWLWKWVWRHTTNFFDVQNIDSVDQGLMYATFALYVD